MPSWPPAPFTSAVVATTHKHLQVLTSVYDKTPQFKMNVTMFIKNERKHHRFGCYLRGPRGWGGAGGKQLQTRKDTGFDFLNTRKRKHILTPRTVNENSLLFELLNHPSHIRGTKGPKSKKGRKRARRSQITVPRPATWDLLWRLLGWIVSWRLRWDGVDLWWHASLWE